ncbi:uncharacterized protein LOC128237941 [Mya arenaria]|uniref:uncharacterized protein LOC128237941 n=1 Tax=Mya arenaria TaxID=6604 RepID=UPI0022E92C81|nr:uncharacterized protein LOC128237941 [Mya arenaria]
MSDHEDSSQISAEIEYASLKQKKSRTKAGYTRIRNRLLDLCKSDSDTSGEELKECLDRLEAEMDKYQSSLDNMIEHLKITKNTKELKKVTEEVEECDSSYEKGAKEYHRKQKEISTGQESHGAEEESKIGKDLWKQLKKVSIPIFHGNKIKFPAWKAAYYSCVDSAEHCSAEYKLLQLRQYLGGEALASIENLGHSAAAYDAAKERLERKYGGTKRIVNRFLDELEKFPPLKNENVKGLENFADLLDIAVINLKEVDHVEDLNDGSLYYRLMKKLPQSIRYNRNVHEQELVEGVETLRTFVNQEAEYAVNAEETIYGLTNHHFNRQTEKPARSYFGNTDQKKDVIAELGISGEKQTVEVNVINGKTERFDTMEANFTLLDTSKNFEIEMTVQTTKNVTGRLQASDWNRNAKKWSHLQGINFPRIGKRSKVDLLIGLDYVELHRSLGEIQSENGSPVARLTPLGWTCVGPTNEHQTNFFTFHINNDEMDNTLQKFWEIENEGVQEKSVMSMKDRDIYESTEKTMKFEDNHYVVEIPWKENRNELLNNYEMAKRRLESTEKKLRKEPVVEKMYNETIQGYLTKGYIEKVETDEKEESLKENNWLLPHFPVVKMNKDTTKVRIVFDASASCKGASLNDVIEQGPSLQNNLFDVLLRFRRDKIAVACDIQEMYLRVGIIPPDRRFHRFLWRPSPELEPDVYQFNRLVFGVNASPFLAQFVSQYNARLYENEYPLAAETVLKSTYMDDSMDSVDNDKVAIRLYKELTALWEKAGMDARKWISNSKTVLEQIPVEHRAKTVDLQKNELPKVKTLGVTWVPEEDIFSFEFTAVDENKRMTKREYLKKISTLFDPLGLLTPYNIRAKMLMQDIWISGVDWDEKVH